MIKLTDPLGNKVILERGILFGHIYRRHPEMRRRLGEIKAAITEPDMIALSKKDQQSLLYFKKTAKVFMLMVVGSPNKKKKQINVRTSFLVLNTAKGDPIIWQKTSL